MQLFRLIPVAFVLTGVSATADAQWFEYQNQQDDFAINMPEEPEVTEITWDSEYGAQFPGRVYTAADQRGNTYKVTVVDYRDAYEIHQNRTNTTEADEPEGYEYWRIDRLASVQYAMTTMFRMREGTEVTYDAWHHIDRVPGQMLTLEHDDGSHTFASAYLHDGRLYVVEGTAPPNAPPAMHVLQSMAFIDDEGNRIRYDYVEGEDTLLNRYIFED